MNFFWETRPALASRNDLDVTVELYHAAQDRIFRNVSGSRTEEGGKFLGNITHSGNRINVKVYSYLDAGPNVKTSWDHLFPDGEHQENLFRLIEGFDPDIEHLGSWHSHHCNGLKELSTADINGYTQTVNARSYNLDWFFVMLVTQVRQTDLEALYYLFRRGDKSYYPIPAERVRLTDGKYPWENILKEVEQATYAYRNQAPQEKKVETLSQSNSNFENEIRADDHGWLKKTYPNVQLVRNKADDSLIWKWTIPAKRADMEITYRHLIPLQGKAKQAALTIKHNHQEILTKDIDLDTSRHEKLQSLIEKTRESIE